MKRVAVVVVGVLLAVAPAGRVFAQDDPPGHAVACSHDNVAEKNKHCGEAEDAPGGGDSGGGSPRRNESGPTTSDRAVACAADQRGDGDPWPDGCDLGDQDSDGIPNQFDNCSGQANNDQADADDDGIGDACDPYAHDGDHDGVSDDRDNCAADGNAGQADGDGDGVGDACDSDQGNNGRPDSVDQVYAAAYDTSVAAANGAKAAVDEAIGAIPTP